jgi:FecR protein
MRLSRLKWIATFFLAAVLSVPTWADNPATPAMPGTLNYVEGQANIGNETLNSKSVGSVDLHTGQTLTTGNGKAEILLTPGVFLRVGDNSAATMISPNLTNTEVGLSKGQAMVEVAEIHKDNLLRVQEDGTTTQLLKTGLYAFNADQGSVQVYKGEALVQDNDQNVKVKGGHELDVNNTAKLRTTKFDKDAYEQSDLFRFSNLRSEYLAEANANAAQIYYPGAYGWYGPGWYWDPLFWDYTWIPGAGIGYSPFGWGFYSPFWVGYSPFYGYGGYYPYGYNRGPARPYYGAHPGNMARGSYPPSRMGGGFRGAAPAGHSFGVMGGGFHGGSGGFHGGGFR